MRAVLLLWVDGGVPVRRVAALKTRCCAGQGLGREGPGPIATPPLANAPPTGNPELAIVSNK